ncbi:MAG: DUF1289 domain-containing protein [Gammaproteobacteria bacterium]|jgi:predicted Fe-S protein YdhL (DUF1289 family)|nr:DUF1289 domain-containing protein [Gammaproteobacteria bacterium]
MEQSELFNAPNPCVGICENSPKGYCKGCMRSREERFNWHQFTVAEQLHIMKLCARRYQRMLAKRRQGGDNYEFEFDDPTPPQIDLL